MKEIKRLRTSCADCGCWLVGFGDVVVVTNALLMRAFRALLSATMVLVEKRSIFVTGL